MLEEWVWSVWVASLIVGAVALVAGMMKVIVPAGLIALLVSGIVWVAYQFQPKPGGISPRDVTDQPASASKGQRFDNIAFLRDGEWKSSSVAVEPDTRARFRIHVPENAVMAEIRLGDAPVNLELYVSHITTFENGGEPEFAAASEVYNEVLQLTPWDSLPLVPGDYIVEVAVAPGPTPHIAYRPVHDEVSFKIAYRLIRADSISTIPWESPVKVELSEQSGYAALYRIDVPHQCDRLRVDLFDTTSTLTLYLGDANPVVHADNAVLVHDGAESSKWFILDQNSSPALHRGSYYLAVVDTFRSPTPIRATLRVSSSANPPESVLRLPDWFPSNDPWLNAVQATVELIAEGSSSAGSGVIVSPKGYVLTNYHVVARPDDRLVEPDGVLIAMTLDEQHPPVDLYRGTVIRSDKELDLAIVQVTKGFYHQPLTGTLRLPFLPLAENEDAHVGKRLWVFGYPWIGGYAGRVTITVSQGVLSGFERQGDFFLWKTDADFHPGSSGGPVLDEQFNVVGLASETLEETTTSGKIGWIRPISSLPVEWRQLLQEANK